MNEKTAHPNTMREIETDLRNAYALIRNGDTLTGDDFAVARKMFESAIERVTKCADAFDAESHITLDHAIKRIVEDAVMAHIREQFRFGSTAHDVNTILELVTAETIKGFCSYCEDEPTVKDLNELLDMRRRFVSWGEKKIRESINVKVEVEGDEKGKE